MMKMKQLKRPSLVEYKVLVFAFFEKYWSILCYQIFVVLEPCEMLFPVIKIRICGAFQEFELQDRNYI
jgi:hypothetical protein